jgi:hypothetical protein
MAETPGAIQFYPWPGGLYTNADAIQIPKNTLQVAQNVVYLGTRDNPGGATLRSAFTRQNAWNTSTQAYFRVGTSTTAEVIYNTDYWANVSNSKRQRFVAVTSARRVRVDSGNGQWSRDITGTSVTLNTFQLGDITSDIMNEDLILGFKNSTTSIAVWDNQSSSTNLLRLSSTTGISGTSSSIFAGINRCYIVRQHQSRMFYAGDRNNPDTLYYSRTAFYNQFVVDTTAASAGSIQIFPGDGDTDGITAIFPSINTQELYIAKRKKMYKLITSDLDPDNWALVKVSDEIGCVNHNTAKTIAQKDVYFESDLGIHSLFQVLSGTGVIEDTLISFSISQDYRDMDQTSKAQHSAVFWPEENLYLHTAKTSGSTVFDKIYAYDLETSAWSTWDSNAQYTNGTSTERLSFNFLALKANSASKKKELFIADNNAYVNFYNSQAGGDLENLNLSQTSTTRAGVAPLFRAQSAVIFPQDTWLRESTFTDVFLLFRARSNVNARVYYRIDNQSQVQEDISIQALGGNILGTTLLGSSTFFLGLTARGVRPVHVNLGGYGYGIEVAVEHDTVGQEFELYGIIIKYEDSEESRSPLGQQGQ